MVSGGCGCMKKWFKQFRMFILIGFLGFVTFESYQHAVLGGGKAASIHALCPFGALESLQLILSQGIMIKRIYAGTFALLLITVILALFSRRSFCGLICPFGTLQELFAKLGQKIFKRKFEMDTRVDSYLRYVKYAMLLIALVSAWKLGELWIAPYDPWVAYGHLFSGFEELIEENIWGLSLLVMTLIGSMLYDRFFCKYMCPMGAFLALVSKLSPTVIKRDEDHCISCGLCRKVCPVNIKVDLVSEVNSVECINCQLCVVDCPVEGALENRVHKWIVKPGVLLLAVMLLYFGGIGLAKVTGYGGVLPERISSTSALTSEDIRGYMTLEEVAIGTGIDTEVLYSMLELSDEVPSNAKMKELKTLLPGFEVEAVREVVHILNGE